MSPRRAELAPFVILSVAKDLGVGKLLLAGRFRPCAPPAQILRYAQDDTCEKMVYL